MAKENHKKTAYLDSFANINRLYEKGLEEWVFHPGMLFNSEEKWWRADEVRERPHEGLDLYLYRNRDGQVRRLGKHIKVPVIFKGEIIRITDDFIGKTIYVRHDMHDEQGRYLCTIYGHTLPSDDSEPGKAIEKHGIIASVVEHPRRNSPPPHLHISIAWVPKSIPYHLLGWETLHRSDAVIFLDPMKFIRNRYAVSEHNLIKP